jgi:hypothetical protein
MIIAIEKDDFGFEKVIVYRSVKQLLSEYSIEFKDGQAICSRNLTDGQFSNHNLQLVSVYQNMSNKQPCKHLFNIDFAIDDIGEDGLNDYMDDKY